MFGRRKAPDGPLPDVARKPLGAEEAAAWAGLLDEYRSRRDKETFALCLEGGGAKGRWQAGFLARAAEVGLLHVVDVVAGTSVGGLNALCVGRYLDESPDLQALVDVWRGIDSDDKIYLGKLPTDFWSAVRGLMAGRLKAEGWLDVSPLRALAKRHLGGMTESRPPVYVVATDYATRKARVLGPDVDGYHRAMATSAVPGAFPAHPVEGAHQMDGGCSQNCPYPFLLDNIQATKLLVLYCDPDPEKVRADPKRPNALNTAVGALAALMQVQSDRAYSDLRSIAQIRELQGMTPIEIQHYYPSRETGGLLDFGAGHDLLQLGYDDAVKYLTPAKVRELLRP